MNPSELEQEQERTVPADSVEDQAPVDQAADCSTTTGDDHTGSSTPNRSAIVKAHSISASVALMVCGLLVPLVAILYPASLPILVAVTFLMILTGISWLRGRTRPPIACPYCGHFDNITLEATTFTCPRCARLSRRVGDFLETVEPI